MVSPTSGQGECRHLSATGVLTTATSDGAMQRAIRSVVHRVRLRRIACTRNTDATSWRLYWRSGRLRAGALASTLGGRYSRPSRKDNPTCRPPPNGRLCLPATTLLILLVTPDRERVVSRPEDGAHAGAHDNDMPTPIPFADDGGTPAWRARHASPPTSRFPIWRFLLAFAALPFLLLFMAAASGAALSLVALAGLAGLVWVVFALLAVALVEGV